MIRVYKSKEAPLSLSSCKKYDSEDIKSQLANDQKGKCYICERKRDTDFEIDHLKSQSNNPDLVYCWDNIFLICGYCNKKKSNMFDNILVPNVDSIEEIIAQTISFENKKAIFASTSNSEKCNQTIKLLNSIFNGANQGLRTLKEERMFKSLVSCINQFNGLIKAFFDNPNANFQNNIREELNIESEFLGFKYQIIKNNPILLKVFAPDIVWNNA